MAIISDCPIWSELVVGGVRSDPDFCNSQGVRILRQLNYDAIINKLKLGNDGASSGFLFLKFNEPNFFECLANKEVAKIRANAEANPNVS